MHQPFEEAINALKSFSIENDASRADETPQARAGYRLLTCNDMMCSTQVIDTGLIHIPHLTKMLVKAKWIKAPRTVLLIKKPYEVDCSEMLLRAARLFKVEFGIRVVVEKAAMDRSRWVAGEHELLSKVEELGVLAATPQELRELPIDLNVCIGGDGTIIWLSHLFPHGVAPTLSIAMGSLGFLSTFATSAMEEALRKSVTNEITLTLRSRLEAHVRRANGDKTVETVLNEVVVDRGPNSSIVYLELYIGSAMATPITHVQGDGIIVATPTGSTAYSLSAGGSIVHPSIPCVVITPICPHSLSFRPIVVSDTTSVRVRVPETARSSAYVSFDGSKQVELRRGDEVKIRVSEHPVPCLCSKGESEDWFQAIKGSFQWNERVGQKQMNAPPLAELSSL